MEQKQTEVLFEQINKLVEQFKEEHVKPTKTAHRVARKHLGELKKLISPYNNASVLEDKNA